MLVAVAAGVGVALIVGLLLRPPRADRVGRDTSLPTRPEGGPDRPGALPAVGAPAGGGVHRRTVLARSRVSRGLLGGLAVVLLGAAGVSATWPFWTNQYQTRLQVRLEQQLRTPEIARAFRADRVASGDSLTRLQMPAIGVDVIVVEGTTQSALRAGAGHYPETALPCGAGNVAIAGHRTTYGEPFARLDEMGPGDEIVLETPIGSCRYRVAAEPVVVSPSAVEYVAPTDRPRLTLTTCHPKGSARQRLVLQADLVGPPLIDDRGGDTPPDIRGET